MGLTCGCEAKHSKRAFRAIDLWPLVSLAQADYRAVLIDFCTKPSVDRASHFPTLGAFLMTLQFAKPGFLIVPAYGGGSFAQDCGGKTDAGCDQIALLIAVFGQDDKVKFTNALLQQFLPVLQSGEFYILL